MTFILLRHSLVNLVVALNKCPEHEDLVAHSSLRRPSQNCSLLSRNNADMAGSTPTSLSAEALGTDFVTLFLGQQAKKFTVHRKLLCDRSELFFKAFCGQGTSSVIRLPEHDAESFNALINWLYRDWLPAYTDDVSTLAPPEKQKKCLALLYGVFVLAENYFINDLMNKTMDQLQDFHCVVFVSMAASDIIGLYRQTYEGSKLRVYIAGRIFISFRASRVGLPPALDKRWIELMRRCPDLAVEYTKFQLEFGFQMYKMLEGGAEFDIKSRGKG